MRKSIPILFGLIFFSLFHVNAQTTRNNTPQNQTNNNGRSNTTDTTPKKPHYVIIDMITPTPVETHTFVSSKLRAINVFPNNDVMELIQLLNPGIYNNDSVMSNANLVLPNFPEANYRTARTIDRAFRDDLRTDENVNNTFSIAAQQLYTLAGIFSLKNFGLENENMESQYQIIKKYLSLLANNTIEAIHKINHTSKKTVETLSNETSMLNNLLLKNNEENTLSDENINSVFELMTDMNILLHLITGRQLEVLTEDNSFRHQFLFINTAYISNETNDKNASPLYDDDDPRKFNIYIFKRSLVQNDGKRDPEMDAFTVSYVIPAFKDEPDLWTQLPDPASTVHAYFSPARFLFELTDLSTGEKYTALEDLFDAGKDPSEKWSLINLFRPTYKLVFLIP